MGYSPIFLLGRSRENLQLVKDSFPEDYTISLITTTQEAVDAKEKAPPIPVAIGTIPADKPIDTNVSALLDILLPEPVESVGEKRILLEMAYKPAVTPLMSRAEKSGWSTVQGLEVLAGQGVGQFELWTEIRPLLRDARVSRSFQFLHIRFFRGLESMLMMNFSVGGCVWGQCLRVSMWYADDVNIAENRRLK